MMETTPSISPKEAQKILERQVQERIAACQKELNQLLQKHQCVLDPRVVFTGAMTSLPLLRPLIGQDKEEIVALARRIGTFATSPLPYPDCCTLFAPPHPLVRPDYERMLAAYAALEAEPLLEEALARMETVG